MRFTRIKNNEARSSIRLPLLGKIRLGIKKIAKSGKEYPAETDYFVCPPEVQAKYGKEPKSLPIMIPVEDEEKFLRQYYACYGSNQKLKCHGDGETAERRDAKGKKEQIPCPSPDFCDYAKQFGCKARIDFLFVLPQIAMGGCYQLSSGSINSDIDIRSGVEFSRYLFERVAWVPMVLSREERKIPDPADGKMQTHYPVKLAPLANVAEVNQIRMDTKRILERQEQFALPEPEIEGREVTVEAAGDEGKQADTEDASEPVSQVDLFVEAIEQASSAEELAKIWKSNLQGINALGIKDKQRIVAAKHKKEEQIKQSAAA